MREPLGLLLLSDRFCIAPFIFSGGSMGFICIGDGESEALCFSMASLMARRLALARWTSAGSSSCPMGGLMSFMSRGAELAECAEWAELAEDPLLPKFPL